MGVRAALAHAIWPGPALGMLCGLPGGAGATAAGPLRQAAAGGYQRARGAGSIPQGAATRATPRRQGGGGGAADKGAAARPLGARREARARRGGCPSR